jgi:glycine betaine/proline transport system permease protein
MTVAAGTPGDFTGFAGRRIDTWLMVWLVLAAFVAACMALAYGGKISWLMALPKEWLPPIDEHLNYLMREIFVPVFKPLFRAASFVLELLMVGLRDLLHWLPWPVMVIVATIMAHAASGRNLAIFTAVSLLYMVVVGYWDESMVTLALVGIAIPLSASIGLFLGLWGARSARVRQVLEPMLDIMQTVPTFAYLTPLILLLGYGPVVGLIASAIFAIPPMVRNVMVSVAAVPINIVESGDMAGCTRRQLTWWVQVPAAMPGIMLGLNQCVMAALSMVIIASIIGGFADIGWEVLSKLRKAETGPSLLAGIVITLLAITMDRISRGFSLRAGMTPVQKSGPWWSRYPHVTAALAASVAVILLAQIVPALAEYPKEWEIYPAQPIDAAVKYVVVNWYQALDALKNAALFFYLLPLRIGLLHSVRANYWGFDMSPTVVAVYVGLLLAVAVGAWRLWSWRGVVPVVLMGLLYFFGTTGIPWPAFMAIAVALAVGAGGWRIGLFAFLSLLFMLIGNAWEAAMWSIYLMIASVAVAFVLGAAIGIWAANNDRVSAVVAPLNDTLQTLPQFVYLIPIIMLFKIGDFSAMLAIIAYAIVPAIRYMEYGLRTVPAHVVEAARSIGCSERQILWQVRLPIAIPQVMLGLNQTIMLGFTMLVIAALVGTRDLGQMVFGSMTSANFGVAVIAGGSIALMAMVCDRIFQGLSARQAKRLGLTVRA